MSVSCDSLISTYPDLSSWKSNGIIGLTFNTITNQKIITVDSIIGELTLNNCENCEITITKECKRIRVIHCIKITLANPDHIYDLVIYNIGSVTPDLKLIKAKKYTFLPVDPELDKDIQFDIDINENDDPVEKIIAKYYKTLNYTTFSMFYNMLSHEDQQRLRKYQMLNKYKNVI